MFLGYLVVS